MLTANGQCRCANRANGELRAHLQLPRIPQAASSDSVAWVRKHHQTEKVEILITRRHLPKTAVMRRAVVKTVGSP